MGISKNLKLLGAAALAVVTLAVVTIMGVAVLTQFKTSGLVDNATVDSFITGLAIFGSFIGVIVIGLIGTIVIKMFKEGGDEN